MTSCFLTPLQVEQICDEQWMLLADFVYESERLKQRITVPRGFVTDFASVPRLPVLYWLAGGKATKAAVVHDFLYRKSGFSRADADAVFAEAMAASGQAAWRRGAMWVGLRVGGWTAYKTAPANSTELHPDPYQSLTGE